MNGLPLDEVHVPGADYTIMKHDIQCLSWTASCSMLLLSFLHNNCIVKLFIDIPSFRSWLLSSANMSSTYAFHKVFLQYLQHQGRNVLSPGDGLYSWLLEFPMHITPYW
jgi:hypothetical protein